MLFKKTSIILTLSFSFISFAYADLKITNNTNTPATSVINNGSCSDNLPNGYGVTQPHSTNAVPDWIIKLACLMHTKDCKAEVHMTNNCSGPVIASVIFDTKKGVQSIQNKDVDGYVVSGSGFDINIDGGTV